jgi:predicted metal-dependent hydrolase
MMTTIMIGSIPVDVTMKNVRNVHLSVHPPTGRVTISAPERMKLETVRLFAISKLPWIREQQRKLASQEREPAREYVERESHYVWGKRYLLSLREAGGPPQVALTPTRLVLWTHRGASERSREAAVEKWYRDQLKRAVPKLIARWEPVIGVRIERFYVQRMKTKWGSCNHRAGTIRLNSELAKKPRGCLEYLVVHELVHLLEPTHNARFQALMDRFMPQWKARRDALNRLPVRGEEWEY